jgi:autotransporter-associated beta strand protein
MAAFSGMAVLALLGGASVQAANITKANTSDALNVGTSWVGGVVPTAADVAVWDSTVTAANTNSILGANTNWAGIKMLNPAGPITILTNTGGGLLTLGSSGIDMSGASQGLTMSNNLALLANTVQSWKVASGQTLSLQGAFTRNAGAILRFDTADGAGNVAIAGGTASTALFYTLFNGTDVGALDASKNLVAGNSVNGYVGNTVAAAPTGQYMDMVNGNTGTGDDVYCGTGIYYPSIYRFNTPQPNRNYWYMNAYRGQFAMSSTPVTVLVTTNVGAQDVIFYGQLHAFRWGSGSSSSGAELFIDQENTAGNFIVNGFMSQKTATVQNMLTKLGAGRAIFNTALVHSGYTRIMEGELMLNGGTVNTSVVLVNKAATLSGSGSANGPTTNFAGGTVHPGGTNGAGSLTVSNLVMQAGSALAFYWAGVPMTNLNGLLLVPGSLTVNGAVTVSVLSGGPALGQFPLVKCASAVSSAAFANFSLGTLPPHTTAFLSNNTANASIDLVVTAVKQPLLWTGASGSVWDLNTTANWANADGSTTYQEVGGAGDQVLFTDSASSTSVALGFRPIPGSVTFSNETQAYTLSGSGGISGVSSLTKKGAGALTLSTANSFNGGLNVNGGRVVFSAMTNLGGAGISFGGGTLQYNGNTDDISVRAVTFASGLGGLDVGSSAVTLAYPVGNSGAGGLMKLGSGTLTLTGTNRYSGATVISNGTLALASSTYISNSSAIVINSGATFDLNTGGSSPITLSAPAAQLLAGGGTVVGGVTVPTGTALSPGTNGTAGTLSLSSGDLTISGGTYYCDITSSTRDLIVVGGNLNLSSGYLVLNQTGTLANGSYKLIQYSGSLSGSSGNLSLTGFSQAGKAAALSDAVAGEIDLVVSEAASDHITWAGLGSDWDKAGSINWTNPTAAALWAFTNGDYVTFDDLGSSQSSVNLKAVVAPVAVTVTSDSTSYYFNDGTGSGGGKITGVATLTKNGTSTLTVNTVNDNTGGTRINGGTLQVSGDIGSGNITNNGELVFSQGTSRDVMGVISGTGNVTQSGSATLTMRQTNTYAGATTIGGGSTLQVGIGAGGGTLGSGSVTDNGVLIFNRSGSINLTNNVAGSGELQFQGTAAVTLASTLAYQGNTYIGGGVVKLTAANMIPDALSVSGSTGWLILNGGATAAGTFNLNGFNETVNVLAGSAGTVSGVVTNSGTSGTNVLTIGNDTGSSAATYAGIIAENPSGAKIRLIKTGANVNYFTPPSFSGYSGGTVISNGVISGGANTLFNANALGTGPVTFYGGRLNLGGFESASASSGYGAFTNSVVIPAGQTGTVGGASRGDFNPVVTGGGTLNYIVQYVRGNVGGDWTGFTGTLTASNDTTVSALTGSGHDFRINTASGLPNAKLFLSSNTFMYGMISGGTIPVGELTGEVGSTISLVSGTAGGQPEIWQVGGLNTSSRFSGIITSNNSLLKVGTGTLTLDGRTITESVVDTGNDTYITNHFYGGTAMTYIGTTTVSNGVLALVVPNTLTNSTAIRIASASAVLDASAMGHLVDQMDETSTVTNQLLVTNSVFELYSGQTLSGLGTLKGALLADSGSVVSSASTTGTLTVTSNVVLDTGSALTANWNRTNAQTSSQLAAGGAITVNGGTLTVTNVGPGLGRGDVFRLFNKAITGAGFTTYNLPASNALNTIQYQYQNNLAVDGTIKVLEGVGYNPTNLIATVSGATLSLVWPGDHIGAALQVQTNPVSVGLSTNWVDVSGSTTVTNMNITIGTGGTVFYRLKQ